MIKGKTKSGIDFTLDERIKDDTRFLFYITRIRNEKLDKETRSEDVINLLTLIFGSDKGVIDFMNAVAATHDGVCDSELLLSELNEMFEAMEVKNSLSSHK